MTSHNVKSPARRKTKAVPLPPRSKVKKLLVDFVRNPAEAKAFVKDADKYLSNKGITILEKDKKALKSCVESQFKKADSKPKEGGHTNLNTHTDYNASDGHVNRPSHTDHTSSY
jgi:hypothetical protein